MTAALYILVEGDTEERFANQVLVPHLANFEVCAYVSRVITRGRRGRPEAQGGGYTYEAWKDDLTTWIKQQGHRPQAWFTTMLDLYGLEALADTFPGFDACREFADPYKKVASLEQAWGQDINFYRFVPYLQLHEFEALLLVDSAMLKRRFVEHAKQVDRLTAEISDVGKAPEQINDGRQTAPSKRIIRHIPQYGRQKADAGSLTAAAIGLPRLRAACPHFGSWLEKLEKLGNIA
jgi:hypothetical protein